MKSPFYYGETETPGQEGNCPKGGKKLGKGGHRGSGRNQTGEEIPSLANGAEQVPGRKKATFLPT